MKAYIYCILAFIIFYVGCQSQATEADIEKWKAEIMQVEKDFNDMAQEEGLVKAFEFYAAEDGVIRRQKKIIIGKAAIAQWYKGDVRPNETLTWKPTFVDVSQSGDMAYTYGDFVFTYPDSLGNPKINKGIFHTVWKRQPDGSWRFVWD
ncbi:nuclear transport factor 2 family protein [Fulvivirga sp. RKSG066]|uniref:YybH family protein n=1 Tax=Fulvivirga aurantia TaxID=2529383 RepID=UPI0012BD2ADC|nr:nuclear transport factor 2 family protein [Fulvivirga aurantia]MTI21508.1 nuclear transport factor 2 family protein [Fulvivirga aurantia]